MQCELAETKQHMEVVLFFSWNFQILQTGHEPLAPCTTCSTDANPDISQHTGHAESGSHHTSTSLDLSKKKKMLYISFLSTLK